MVVVRRKRRRRREGGRKGCCGAPSFKRMERLCAEESIRGGREGEREGR